MSTTPFLLALAPAFATLTACHSEGQDGDPSSDSRVAPYSAKISAVDGANAEGTAVATFAGGCFWCMEGPFEKLDGVTAVISGYTGGQVENPTYEQVCSGTTGHAEAVQVHYRPELVGYDDLLQVFWRQINPTDSGGQFADRGTQYRSEIFFHDEAQKSAAEASKKALAASGRFDDPIATGISKAVTFYRAEEYHQDYYKKNPSHYNRYRQGSGRAGYLERTWGEDAVWKPKPRKASWKSFEKPSEDVLRDRLTPLQYRVTQEEGTERPFNNDFFDNHKQGIYVDIVSGEPLFSSLDKFDSGTGWPSFTRPLVDEHIHEKSDRKLGYVRTEVRSKYADSHLGHVFEDGPAPTGLRYCINSAALRFVPADQLAQQGYGEFAAAFQGSAAGH